MKKLLILLSIFFLLSNSNIKPAGRSDAAAAEAPAKKKQRKELEEKADSESKDEKESKQEAAPVGKYPDDRPKDRKILEQLRQQESLYFFPVGILRLMLDYCKSKFEPTPKFSAHAGWIQSLVILNETHFASSSEDGTIKIWQYIRSTIGTPEKYECIQALDRSKGHTDSIKALIRLDDKHFISCSKDQTIKIWELIPDSTPIQYRCIQTLDRNNNGHTDIVNSLMELDDNHFVSGSEDNTIKIWEFIPVTDSTPITRLIHTLDLNNNGHRRPVMSMTRLNKTHFASGSYDKTIKIWEFNPRAASVPPKCIQTLDQDNDGHINWVTTLVKLDDNHFASGSFDRTIKIWELIPDSTPIQYRCIQTLDRKNGGHFSSINSLVKLDETHFVSGSFDRTIKIWELIPDSTPIQYRCIQRLNIYNIPVSLTRMFNGDLIAGLYDGSIQVLNPVVDIE